ncbi:MAG: hypothetical protein ABW187_10955 [Dokdonella sp.]
MTTARARTTARHPPAIGRLCDVEQHSLAAATRVYASLFGNVVRAQTEMLRFLSARFAKDALLLEQLVSCQGPSDLAQLQVKSGADAMADYFAATQRPIGLAATSARAKLAQAA